MLQVAQLIENYRKDIEAYEAANAQEAEAFRIKYLGSKGIVKAMMGEMKNVENDQKRYFGVVLNEFKKLAEEKYESLKNGLSNVSETSTANMDWSLPGDTLPVGTRHPLSI
jgi:phenylalanyl-tRNA synthetase alpha chain